MRAAAAAANPGAGLLCSSRFNFRLARDRDTVIDSTHHARVSVRVAYTVIAVFVSATAAAALDLLLLLCDLSHVFFSLSFAVVFLAVYACRRRAALN